MGLGGWVGLFLLLACVFGSVAAEVANQTRSLPSYVSSDAMWMPPASGGPLAPIVLVGNGPSVLTKHYINGSTLGEIVDTYEEVGRFNLHKTKGFEQLVGSKTTICFMGQLKRPQKQKPFCPRYIVPVVAVEKSKHHKKVNRGTIKQVVKRFYSSKGLANKMEFMTDHVQKALKNKYKLKAGPSTGIQAILYCVQKYKKVAIAGFDFLRGDHKHYFEKKKKKNTSHDMKGEANVILSLESEGKLFIIDKYK
ncbi:hypothetical protein HOP50_10g60180 [Chloropicon primus]|uniref:Uncharacterized protein n=1 Tax=Chloropicon primus TaxID=1764295 RepID=A0A5B8MSA6_9CHLO|nr:hypothetical protein A3770_10p59970 [Chloropicon primus]UPR02691.1 hypothetical protein HOP50_10g60180 [Chloropicon primus]|eukprot:QDZ23479.1 hypothetical protein A3770_10p59970 [Chloropicon primus]